MGAAEKATCNFLSANFKNTLKFASDVWTLDLGKGTSVSSVCSIAKHLQRTASDYNDLCLLERMQAEQWIEYATTTVKCTDSESQKNIFKELNSWLKDRAYFVANRLTVADIIMFYNLYPLMADFSFQEKELYINVARWFSNVQQEQKVRQSLQHLTFLRTPVYDGFMVRAH